MIDAVPWLISGVALGIGLAIVQELRDVVSPFLLIQLLRVLLPALLVVLAVFILALPFRGLGNLFGQFSAAITLLVVTIAGITLVTTAIHRDDALSVQGRVMRSATWALSVILPVPALLALWAVWMRVDQYGLTPDRVAALVAAGVTAVYALAYAGAALWRVSWSGRQRRVNRGMALLTLVIAAVWLTPILDAERLSVASQMARIEKGVPREEMAVWEMAHRWGVAGERGLTQLEAHARGEGDEKLVALIEKARTHTQYWQFTSDRDEGTVPPLAGVIPLRPEGITLFPGAIDGLHSDQRRMIVDACQRRAPGGHPGCVLVLAEFEPERAGQQAIGLFLTGGNSVQMMSFTLEDDVLFSEGYPRDLLSDAYPAARPQIISDIIEGRYSITPAPRNVLEVGGMWLFPQY